MSRIGRISEERHPVPDVAAAPSGGERVTVLVCCVALFMTTLDNTILNVAIPSLQQDFHAGASGLQWTVDSYVLVRASVLFTCGAIADRFGRRRWFRIGLVGFSAGSLACSLAPSLGVLVACRVFQGVGGALMVPSSLAIITNAFPDRRRRARALGVWSACVGLSTAAGPVLGGLLVESMGWRSVFWVNVPIGMAALAATRLLSESRAAKARTFDIPGQLLIAGALATLTWALIVWPDPAWSSLRIDALLFACVACTAGFIAVERRRRSPLIVLADFRSPELSGAVVLAIVAFLGLGGFVFFNTLYLQELRGYSPLVAGLLTMPTMGMTLLLSPVSARLVASRGPRLPAALACVLIGGGMAVLAAVITPPTPLWRLLVGYVLFGSGLGLVNPPITTSAVSGMHRDRAGVAGATTSTARQVGTALGVALLGSVIFATIAAEGVPYSQWPAWTHGPRIRGSAVFLFADGLRNAYVVAACLAVVGLAVALWAFRPTPQRRDA